MRENGMMIKYLVKVLNFFKMVISMMVILRMVKWMDKGFLCSIMGENLKENLKKIK